MGLLQREEMQAQLQELESKILTHVAEMQGKSAREAAASLGMTLQKEGVIGVTEEVRPTCPLHTPTHSSPPWEPWTVPHCQLPGRFHDGSAKQEALHAVGPAWVGGSVPTSAWAPAQCKPRRGQPMGPWPTATR